MKKVSFIVSAAALLLPLGVLADGHEEEPSLTDVWIMMPKRGMEAQFSEAVTAHMARRKEAGEERSWNAYTVAVGHKIGPVQFRACCFDWADQDAYLAADYQATLGADWNENVDQYVDHYHHYIEEIDRENSHWEDGEATEGPYYGVTTWHWKEGAGPAPSEMRKKLSQIAMEEGGWADSGRNWMWLSRMGGKPVLMIVAPFSSYADMAPPETTFFDMVSEKVGAEDASEMFTTFGSGFSSSDYTVWQHAPELSTPGDDD